MKSVILRTQNVTKNRHTRQKIAKIFGAIHVPLASSTFLKMKLEIEHCMRKYETGLCLIIGSSRDTLRDLVNMAEDVGRKWDRCLADTALKTGEVFYLCVSFLRSLSQLSILSCIKLGK